MFDFEKLDVYQKAKSFNSQIRNFIKTSNLDSVTRSQLSRASFSIVLNIAEGSGRFTKPDRRNFYVISRGSVFESISILDVLKDEGSIDEDLFKALYAEGEQISKILYKLIRNLESK